MLPANASGGRATETGTMSAVTSIVATSTYGVARNTHEVVVETTTSFPSSFRRSAYGCHGSGRAGRRAAP